MSVCVCVCVCVCVLMHIQHTHKHRCMKEGAEGQQGGAVGKFFKELLRKPACPKRGKMMESHQSSKTALDEQVSGSELQKLGVKWE